MVETRQIFDVEEYLRRMNDSVFAAELDPIDHYPAEDDTPDQRKFKDNLRDLQADVTQVRLAAWHAHNRGMTSFELPVDVDLSVQNFVANAEFAVKAVVDFKFRNEGMIRYFEADSSCWRITEDNVGLLESIERHFADYERWQVKYSASFSTRYTITRQIWWEMSKRARLILFLLASLERW